LKAEIETLKASSSSNDCADLKKQLEEKNAQILQLNKDKSDLQFKINSLTNQLNETRVEYNFVVKQSQRCNQKLDSCMRGLYNKDIVPDEKDKPTEGSGPYQGNRIENTTPPKNEEETATKGGQAPKGNATNKPPDEAQKETKAEERRANEARHTRPPTGNEETEKTEAEGKEQRTTLSTPEAQPTATEPEKEESTGKKARAEKTAEEEEERDPEKATQGNEQTNEERETIINYFFDCLNECAC
jgi:hypothetical protein